MGNPASIDAATIADAFAALRIEAERLVLGDVSTGASGFGNPRSDLARATELASVFVDTLGMSGLAAPLRTFRDKDGVWAKYDVEEVATPQGFARNPALVHSFYNGRRAGLKSVKPIFFAVQRAVGGITCISPEAPTVERASMMKRDS